MLESAPDLKGRYKNVESRSTSRPFRVPPGRYKVRIVWGAVDFLDPAEIEIKADEDVVKDVLLNAGVLNVKILDGEGGPETKGYLYIFKAEAGTNGKRQTVTSGPGRQFQLPAGRYLISSDIKVKAGTVEAEVKSGEATDAALILKPKQ